MTKNKLIPYLFAPKQNFINIHNWRSKRKYFFFVWGNSYVSDLFTLGIIIWDIINVIEIIWHEEILKIYESETEF